MRRLFLGLVLSVAALAVAPGAASACMWDRELVAHEKQFKSSYLEQPAEARPATPAESAWPVIRLLAAGAGALLLLGSVAFVCVRPWQRPRAWRGPFREGRT
jgi:hypothetical protein